MKSARIFNIQRFSIHDGDGIRTTVFFKGCPLSCRWCHNPESLSNKMELLYDAHKCTLCGNCISKCTSNALSINNSTIVRNENCTLCHQCILYCSSQIREIVGRDISLEELLKEVKKDSVFYEESLGGVTLSGGEPMMQIDFVEQFVSLLHKERISVAIDTSGALPFRYFERVAPYVDIFLYDIKHTSTTLHKQYTGVDNVQILSNLVALSKIHQNIYVRMPIIEGFNCNVEHINSVISLLKETTIKKIFLLPYHNIASHKYSKLGVEYRDDNLSVPSQEKLNLFSELLTTNGFDVSIGG